MLEQNVILLQQKCSQLDLWKHHMCLFRSCSAGEDLLEPDQLQASHIVCAYSLQTGCTLTLHVGKSSMDRPATACIKRLFQVQKHWLSCTGCLAQKIAAKPEAPRQLDHRSSSLFFQGICASVLPPSASDVDAVYPQCICRHRRILPNGVCSAFISGYDTNICIFDCTPV